MTKTLWDDRYALQSRLLQLLDTIIPGVCVLARSGSTRFTSLYALFRVYPGFIYEAYRAPTPGFRNSDKIVLHANCLLIPV
jgi:hypothetical protein